MFVLKQTNSSFENWSSLIDMFAVTLILFFGGVVFLTDMVLHDHTLVPQPENVVLLLQVKPLTSLTFQRQSELAPIDGFTPHVQWIHYEAGFLTCAITGIVFVVFTPIIAMLFCMCRCCDNCGGEMHQRQRKNADCHRGFFTASLVATTVFIM